MLSFNSFVTILMKNLCTRYGVPRKLVRIDERTKKAKDKAKAAADKAAKGKKWAPRGPVKLSTAALEGTLKPKHSKSRNRLD